RRSRSSHDVVCASAKIQSRFSCSPCRVMTGRPVLGSCVFFYQCSSHEAAEGQPAKRMKCEESSLKSELEGLTCERGNLAALGETPKTFDGDGGSGDPGDSSITQQEKDESIPETDEGKQGKECGVSLEPHAVKSSEESSCGSFDGATSEDTDQPRRTMLLEHSSCFSDEDSNQPMPVHLPCFRLSPEARKLHFIAKEDDDDEEEDVV
uniref:Uncharacterized protein n=1 Tax=Catharus ustulatus TaxID=91951 RepID=A0A8C3UIV5_CATUS